MKMPRKTDGEKIHELEKLVATLSERIDTARNEMIDGERFAVLEERMKSLQESVSNASTKRSAVLTGLGIAIVTVILTLLGNWILAHLSGSPPPPSVPTRN
jgi:hypothetical protein